MKRHALIALMALIVVSCGNNGGNRPTPAPTETCGGCQSSTVGCAKTCGGCQSSTVGCAKTCGGCQSATVGCAKTTIADGGMQVIYFHGRQRCVTCQAIERVARETVGKIDNATFTVIDISTPDGEKIADDFKVSSSSLFVVKGGRRENLTATGFRYAKNNPEELARAIKESISTIE